jgi:glycosyltransferase involved in cell wall biosynthesis
MMQEKPLVTIITITFNVVKAGREKTFRQCLESVHSQTYKSVEHLIIDGASNDGTLDIIREYEALGWIKFVSEPDKGIYDAMNKGLRMAYGKYVSFVNSDDFYHDKKGIEMSVNALEECGADFSYAPVIIFDEKFGVKIVNVPDISKIFFSIVPNHQTMFIKKQAIIDEGLFDLKYEHISEYDLHIRFCLKNYRSVFVKDDFITYRLGGDSYIASKNGLVFKEVSDIYYKNYNKLCSLTLEECEKICGDMFHSDYSKVPLKLAINLKSLKPYFNYDEYTRCMRFIFIYKILRRVKLLLRKPYRLIKSGLNERKKTY